MIEVTSIHFSDIFSYDHFATAEPFLKLFKNGISEPFNKQMKISHFWLEETALYILHLQ